MSREVRVWNLRSQGYKLGYRNPAFWLLDSRSQTAGFTLLEVLVAGTILSLVLAALYGVFSRTLASKRLAEERAARARAARIVLLRIGQDLQATFPPGTGRFHFIGETHGAGAFPEDSLSFLSLAHTSLNGTSSEGDVYEIAYALFPDPGVPTQRQLVRRVTLDLGVTDLTTNRWLAEDAYPLLSHVRGLRFRFFDGRNWREEWGRDDTQGVLPQAVEVVLYLEALWVGEPRISEPQEEIAAFSTVIDLPVAGLPPTNTRRLGAS